MRAFVLEAPRQTSIRDVAQPQVCPGEVLLRVRLVGMCGTDLSSFRGHNPLVSYPRIPGHEIAATVVQTGIGVPPHLRAGMNVAVSPYTSCGQCPACRRARPNACRGNQTLGVQRDGAMTEYISVPWQKVHAANDLSLRELCLVEPLAVGFHAVARGRVAASDAVAVFGAGGVGLGVIAGAAARCARVIAIDVDDRKLTLARAAGAGDAINSATESLHECLAALTGDGPDVVVEAIGLPQTFRAAVEEVAATGRVVYIGYAKEPVCYDSHLFILKELDILGSRNSLDEFPAVIAQLQQHRFPVDEAIRSVVPLAEAGRALAAWDQNPADSGKIVVEL